MDVEDARNCGIKHYLGGRGDVKLQDLGEDGAGHFVSRLKSPPSVFVL